MAKRSKVPTPTELARLYGAGHDALTAALDAGCLPADLQNKWPNLLGTLRRVEGQPYHRPGLNGREDPLTDEEKRVLAWEFRKAAQRAEAALKKCGGRAANPAWGKGVWKSPPQNPEGAFQVIRKGWDKPTVVGTFSTRKEAETDRRNWEQQTTKDFKEGRIMYDVPDFEVVETRRSNPHAWSKVFG